jgi:hypothetical protein
MSDRLNPGPRPAAVDGPRMMVESAVPAITVLLVAARYVDSFE